MALKIAVWYQWTRGKVPKKASICKYSFAKFVNVLRPFDWKGGGVINEYWLPYIYFCIISKRTKKILT